MSVVSFVRIIILSIHSSLDGPSVCWWFGLNCANEWCIDGFLVSHSTSVCFVFIFRPFIQQSFSSSSELLFFWNVVGLAG